MHNFHRNPLGVPPDTYRARFIGLDDTTHPEFGPGLRFRFEVVAGAFTGQTISRITATTVTPLNSAGQLFAGLLGHGLAADDVIDTVNLVGREFFVEVEVTQNGATRVARIVPADDA